MSRVLPILFNVEMVRAILDGRKTVTRRTIPERILDKYCDYDEYCKCVMPSDIPCKRDYEKEFFMNYAPYQPEDILYVRETWHTNPLHEYGNEPNKYVYKADYDGHAGDFGWKPAIHMPKEAARIWLEVTDVRVERIHKMSDIDARKEGIEKEVYPLGQFIDLWDSAVDKKKIEQYGWDANPWVWVIEFERCEKPEGGVPNE